MATIDETDQQELTGNPHFLKIKLKFVKEKDAPKTLLHFA